jgi:FdhD protein
LTERVLGPTVRAMQNELSILKSSELLRVAIDRVEAQTWRAAHDVLAVEEPLEIRLDFHHHGERRQQSLSVTMRTPGHDFELAAGFLLSEGIVRKASDLLRFEHCGKGPARGNIVKVELAAEVTLDLAKLQRNFYTTSSCGVCGKASLEALGVTGCEVVASTQRFHADALHALPGQMRNAQAVFERTGGLHAAALFTPEGTLEDLREDVGRHNAVDKLLGARLLAGQLPLSQRGLLLSGRASFEILQKAVVAGLPLVAAVGAPSSLAVQTAEAFGLTLVGFLRDNRFNVYAGAHRLDGRAPRGT